MMNVNFAHKEKIIFIQCTKNVKMKEIFEKFEKKVNIENNSVFYLYNGNKLNEENKLEEIIGNNDINNDIKIIVNSIDNIKNNNIIKSKYHKEWNNTSWKNHYFLKG